AALDSAVSVAWPRIPFSAGCFGAWTDNARARDLPRVAAGDRRVIFAGEHVSQIPAWMEGAVQSAHAGLKLLQQQWEARS
ncbi:FAD-dependent oxidoreductase, partial [uncultured Lamprocystis sp.]